MFISDESHFSDLVSVHNVCIWSLENVYAIQQVPLHSVKVVMWSAISVQQIIDLNAFHKFRLACE
jgi:hypothetical protein